MWRLLDLCGSGWIASTTRRGFVKYPTGHHRWAEKRVSGQQHGHPPLHRLWGIQTFFWGKNGVTAFLLTPLTPLPAMGTLEYVTEHSKSHGTASELKQAAPTPERCRGAALRQGAGNLRSFLLIDPSLLSLPS